MQPLGRQRWRLPCGAGHQAGRRAARGSPLDGSQSRLTGRAGAHRGCGWGGYGRRKGNSSGSDYAPARVFESRENPLLGPGLAVSRTLGDLNAERAGVVPTPEVLTHRVAAEDRFVLLASDGVWEFIDMNEAVEIVDQFYSEGKRARIGCVGCSSPRLPSHGASTRACTATTSRRLSRFCRRS